MDRHKGRGQFILAGSFKPDESETVHSGTGRFGRLFMRPLTLYESGDSTGEVSLSSLFGSGEVSDLSLIHI